VRDVFMERRELSRVGSLCVKLAVCASSRGALRGGVCVCGCVCVWVGGVRVCVDAYERINFIFFYLFFSLPYVFGPIWVIFLQRPNRRNFKSKFYHYLLFIDI